MAGVTYHMCHQYSMNGRKVDLICKTETGDKISLARQGAPTILETMKIYLEKSKLITKKWLKLWNIGISYLINFEKKHWKHVLFEKSMWLKYF